MATLVVARWTGDLDMARLRSELDAGPVEDPEAEYDEHAEHMAADIAKRGTT